MKKEKGKIEFFISSIALSITSLLVLMGLRIEVIKTTKSFIDDGLVASTLASATIDLKEFGTTNNIINSDFSKSYNDFTKTLKTNLNLDNSFIPKDDTLINSKVDVVDFIIYNVVGNDIYVLKKDEVGYSEQFYPNQKGIMKTPNDVLITSTTFYSKIGFSLRGYLEDTHYVYKDYCVDVTSN